MKNVPDPFFGPLFRALGSGSTQKNQPRRWSPSEPDFVFQAFDRVLGKLSLTPFLVARVRPTAAPGKYLVDAERSGPRVRFAYPGYAGPRSREIVPDTFSLRTHCSGGAIARSSFSIACANATSRPSTEGKAGNLSRNSLT